MEADRRLQEIAGEKKFRICSSSDCHAVSFRNPRTGALEGLETELAQSFAADLGVLPTVVKNSFPASSTILESIAARCTLSPIGARD